MRQRSSQSDKKGKKDVESAEKLLLAGGYQLAVESVAFGLDTPFCKRSFHGAAGLRSVRTVVEAATVHTIGNIRHGAQNINLGEMRKSKFLEPGAVNECAFLTLKNGAVERRVGSGLLAEIKRLGKLLRAGLSLGAKHVENGALAHAGERVLLMGQSGMGKSTILNLLVPEANAQTREFSEALDLGKQTTTAAAWHAAPEWQGAVIDTPGFQEFGLAHLSLSDILRAMPDIAEHAVGCRFFNCRHLHEPGCGVKAALEAGLIDPARYAFYEAAAKDADPLPR